MTEIIKEENQETMLEKIKKSAIVFAQVLMLVAFVFGICDIGGAYSLVAMVTSLFGVLSMVAVWYVYILTAIQCILYAITLVFLISNLVKMIKALNPARICVYGSPEGIFTNSIQNLIIYILVSGILFSLKLTAWGVVTIVVTAIVYLGGHLIDEISIKNDKLMLAYSMAKRLLIVLLIILLSSVLLKVPSAERALYGLRYLQIVQVGLEGAYLLWINVFAHVFNIVLVGIFISFLDEELLEMPEYSKSGWTKFMVAAIIFVVAEFLMYATVRTGGAVDIAEDLPVFLKDAKTVLAVMFLAIAGRVITWVMFEKKLEEQPIKEENSPKVDAFRDSILKQMDGVEEEPASEEEKSSAEEENGLKKEVSKSNFSTDFDEEFARDYL